MTVKKVISYVNRLTGSHGSLRRRLVRSGAGIAFIQVLSRLLTLLLGVILARGLGVNGYGVYAYASSVLTLLLVFAELGMPTLVMREAAASHARQDWPYLRGLFVWSGQLVCLASITLAAMGTLVLWQYGDGMLPPLRQTLFGALVLLPLTALTREITAALRGLQLVVKAQATETLIRPFLVLLVIGLLFTFVPNMRQPQYAIAVQAGAGLVVLCLAAALLYRCLPQPVHTTTVLYHTRQWLTSAMPLTLIGGAGILNNQTDILMLGFFRTPTDVGIYHVSVQGAALVGFGLHVANAVIAPQFARLYSLGDMAHLQHLVTASARIILLTALPVAGIFIVAGGVITGWVFGPEFTKSHMPLAILAAGQLVNAAIGSAGFLLNMTKHERDVARTLLITAGLNVLFNLALIPPFGMAGAASATSVSLAMCNIMLYKIVKKRLGINSLAFILTKIGAK